MRRWLLDLRCTGCGKDFNVIVHSLNAIWEVTNNRTHCVKCLVKKK